MDRPLHVAYVDIKAAFGSVDRVALWKALKGKGVRLLILQLLEDLHSQTGAKVRSGGKLSRRFNTSSGLRQRCVLAPALFCIAIDRILSQVAPQVSITVGDRCFTVLDYADEAVIFLSDEDQAGAGLFQCTEQRGCSIWSKDVMDQNKSAEFGKWARLQ